MYIFGNIVNSHLEYNYNNIIEKCSPAKDIGWGCLHRSAYMLIKHVLKTCGRSHNLRFEDILHFSKAEREKLSTPTQACNSIIQSLSLADIPVSMLNDSIANTTLFPKVFIYNTRCNSGSKVGSNIKMIKKALKIPYFCGALGGTPRKATFIIGVEKNKYICLDPHINEKSIHLQNIEDLDPCIIFTFLIKCPVELVALISACKTIFNIEIKNSIQNIISYSLKEEEDWILFD